MHRVTSMSVVWSHTSTRRSPAMPKLPKFPVGRFNCPNCDASYMVVQVQGVASTFYRQIACRSCGGPLDGQKGRFILKYFLLKENRRDRAQPGRKCAG
jgi:hypothetical protein